MLKKFVSKKHDDASVAELMHNPSGFVFTYKHQEIYNFVDYRIYDEDKGSCCGSHSIFTFECIICGIYLSKNCRKGSMYDQGGERKKIIDNHCNLAKHSAGFNRYSGKGRKNVCGFCDMILDERDTGSHLLQECEKILPFIQNIREDTQLQETLIRSIVADAEQYFAVQKPQNVLKSINPIIYDYFNCHCGNGQISKCMICGVVLEVGRNDHGLVDTMYASALMEHFGVNRKDIKFDHTDFISPIEKILHKNIPYPEEVYGDGTEDIKEYFSAHRRTVTEIIGYKCAICNVEYAGSEIPPSEIVLYHITDCMKNLKKFCKDMGIRAAHNSLVGRQRQSE